MGNHAHRTAVNEHNGWQLGQFSMFLTLFYHQFHGKSKAQVQLIFVLKSMAFKAEEGGGASAPLALPPVSAPVQVDGNFPSIKILD